MISTHGTASAISDKTKPSRYSTPTAVAGFQMKMLDADKDRQRSQSKYGLTRCSESALALLPIISGFGVVVQEQLHSRKV